MKEGNEIGGIILYQGKIARQLTDFGLNPKSIIIRLLSFLIDLEPFCVRGVVLITSGRSAVSHVSYNGSCIVWPLKSFINTKEKRIRCI